MGYDSRRSISPIALTRRDILAGGAAVLAQLPVLGATTARGGSQRGHDARLAHGHGAPLARPAGA